ncbi:PD-(D/E)XK nuclease family protein [Thioalkalivibrio sp. ALE16]|uniref:PD-(D/E)XK nuclease family protein n=1 Tax=Thioalkalivibrio sp. ALE16 TaxID=1158172 RepID=UPI00036B61B0|nr:PD-(D/E)XK nuclease family protein [Thioalkalivibrio sp. ALE16]
MMIVRPTSILSYENCPRQYLYKEVLKIKPLVTAANLVLGGCLHKPITDWLEAYSLGEPVETPEALGQKFLQKWKIESKKGALEYSAKFGPSVIPAMGQRLVQQFAERWPATQLSVVINDAMEPVVEKRLQVDIGQGLILSTQPDTVVITPESKVAALDLKSAASPASEEFVAKSDQLTAQQIVLESHRDALMVSSIDMVGFLEMIKQPIPKTKQGQGPQVKPPVFVPARSKREKKEYLEKVFWIAEDIDRERFPATPRMAYNSPCDLCNYHRLCKHGDTAGLQMPQQWSEQQARLAA